MVFMGRGFTSGLGSVFNAAVCKIQTSKLYIRFLPLEKRSCFSQSERFAVQLPFDRVLAHWLNWYLESIYMYIGIFDVGSEPGTMSLILVTVSRPF